MTLTPNQQAAIQIVSGALIGAGAASVPLGAPWYVGFGISVVGAVGLGLKEVLQGQTP